MATAVFASKPRTAWETVPDATLACHMPHNEKDHHSHLGPHLVTRLFVLENFDPFDVACGGGDVIERQVMLIPLGGTRQRGAEQGNVSGGVAAIKVEGGVGILQHIAVHI